MPEQQPPEGQPIPAEEQKRFFDQAQKNNFYRSEGQRSGFETGYAMGAAHEYTRKLTETKAAPVLPPSPVGEAVAFAEWMYNEWNQIRQGNGQIKHVQSFTGTEYSTNELYSIFAGNRPTPPSRAGETGKGVLPHISGNILTRDGLSEDWLKLWSEVEHWYGDVKKRESGQQFLLRMQSEFPLASAEKDRAGEISPVLKLDIAAFSKLSATRAETGFKTYRNVPITYWTTALMGEGGELCNMIKKMERVAHGGIDGGSSYTAASLRKTDLAEEIGGIFIYLNILSGLLDIDMEEAIIYTFNSKSEKYGFPERYPEIPAPEVKDNPAEQ